MFKQAPFSCRTAPIPNQTHGIYLKKEGDRATLGSRFGIKHMRHAKALLERLHAGRILAQQVSKIGCRLMGGSNGQQHISLPSLGDRDQCSSLAFYHELKGMWVSVA